MLVGRLPLSLLGLLAALIPSSYATQESYSESLRLTPFADGKVHSSFSFEMNGSWIDEGELLGLNAVGELLLALECYL